MIFLLINGQIALFVLLVVALIISLTFHEYGHAAVAKMFGDPTAERLGRLTLNPIAHIDPMGLAMVVLVGFGYAKPVPTDPRNFTRKSADLWVAAAGPFMNLLVAVVALNVYLLALKFGMEFTLNEGVQTFFNLLVSINLMLMLFNLIPLGPLDGHYIFPYLLPEGLRAPYRQLNASYGSFLFLGLIVLSVIGIPVFSYVMKLAGSIIPWISFVS